MNLDLKQVLAIARRRWWLVALMMVVAAGSAFVSASRDTKLYSASATMMIMPGQSFTGPIDYNAMLVPDRLVESYPRLITGTDLQRRVADELGLDTLPGSISASVTPDSQLIVVSVVDTDPERAASVANTVVSEFGAYLVEEAQGRAKEARQGLDGQVAALRGRIDELDARLRELDTDANADDRQVQRQIGDLSQERATLNTAMADLTTQSATISSQVIASATRVEPVGVAVAPSQPFEPRPRRSAMLGGIVGLMLAVGLVALLEYLDNTVKPSGNLQVLTGAPLLATVPLIDKLEAGGRQIYTLSQPQSSAAEAIRLLRTNLDFIAATSELRSIAITSSGQGEGKSTTAANLAVAMAQAGLRTVLIDADLRQPTQATIFGVSNGSGLTTLLTRSGAAWTDVARNVRVPGLQMIPSGPIPPNPSDLVGTRRFEEVLEHIKAEVDWVVIDTPPVLAASDALAVAAHTDGLVLVALSYRTRLDAIRHATAAAEQAGIRLIGIVLNRQKGQRGAFIYGEEYGSVDLRRYDRRPTTTASAPIPRGREPLSAHASHDGLS